MCLFSPPGPSTPGFSATTRQSLARLPTPSLTFLSTTKRIYPEGSTGGSFQLDATSPVIFTSDEPVEDSELAQIVEDGATYLVKEGTGEQGTKGWKTEWRDENLPTNFFWPGQGSAEANAQLRIDLEAPTA